jgi:hypothetical protein
MPICTNMPNAGYKFINTHHIRYIRYLEKGIFFVLHTYKNTRVLRSRIFIYFGDWYEEPI